MAGVSANDPPLDRLTAEKLIFQAATFIADAHRRREFLDIACDGDDSLRRRVDALLDDADDSFMQTPAAGAFSELGSLATQRPAAASAAAETLRCPNCRTQLDLPREVRPESSTCDHCGTTFRIDWTTARTERIVEMQQQLGRYELLNVVGSGSFGTVYQARDHDLDRIVAIKIPRDAAVHNRSDVDRFLREARSVARLRHPAIVSIFEVGTSSGMPYLVSEFVSGVTLAEAIATRRPSSAESAALVAAIADAIQYAHEMGVIHRDLKPANIMLDDADRPRVMDFGLAKRDAGDVTMTMEGQILGTPAYMSPEQARGESHAVDGRTDVYSLGVVLYQLLTGELPFRGSTRMLLHQVLHEEPPRPRSLSDHVPRDLETICLKAMAKDAHRRYAAARDIADDLRRFLRNEPIQARPVGRFERVWRWSRRNAAVAGLTALVSLLVLAIAMGGAAVVSFLLMAIAVGGAVAAFLFRRRAQREKLLRRTGEENLYFHRIALAHREILADNLGESQKLLAECPAQLRDWEWRYLDRLSRVDPAKPISAGGAIFSIDFSPDGRRIATAQKDGRVGLFNLELGDHYFLGEHERRVFSVAFQPQGEYLASAGADRKVIVWSVKARAPVFMTSGHEGRYTGTAYALAFSPDGQTLAAPSDEETVTIWRVPDGTRIRDFSGPTRMVACVAYSPDGRLLAAGSFDNKLTIWDVETGVCHRTFDGHKGPITAVAFSPRDARYVASASYDRLAIVWDVATGKQVSTLNGHVGLVVGLRFSQDGRRLATMGGEDRVVKLWEPIHGQEILSLKGHTSFCQCVAISRDGRRLASSGSDGTIRIWDAAPLDRGEGHRFLEMRHEGEVWSATFSPDGRFVASAGWDQTVRIWDAVDGRSLEVIPLSSAAFCVRFRPLDGKYLAATSGMSLGSDTELHVWKSASWAEVFPPPEHSGNPFCVEFSPDGKYVLKPAQDQNSSHFVHVRDAKTGSLVGSFADHAQDIWAIRFSPDGRGVVTGGTAYEMKLWRWTPENFGQMTELWRAELPKVGFADMLAFSPDGEWVITGGDDKTVRIRSAKDGSLLKSLGGHTGNVFAVAFSPNGEFFASGGEDTTIRLWDATSETPREIYKLRGHIGVISSLAFSPGGSRLVSGSRDRTVKVWDLSKSF